MALGYPLNRHTSQVMPKNNSISKKLAIACIAIFLAIIIWGSLVSAPTTSQESRVYSLELDVRGIESRLNRIESQLNQIGGSAIPAPPQSSSNLGRNRQRLSGDPMFDRLATLAIELKERIDKLDGRVSKLESRATPNNR